MITALICTHKAGDVLPLAVEPLLRSDAVSRVLIADGPSGCEHAGAIMVEEPAHEDLPFYNHEKIWWVKGAEPPEHRAAKCNLALRRVSEETTWILVVDSDEIWSVRDLDRLIELAEAGRYDRWRFRTINPFPDFAHGFEIPNDKPRLYRWFEDARCPDRDRLHQYVLSDQQRRVPEHENHWGCAFLEGPTVYHLNALRAISQCMPMWQRRVIDNLDDTITWRGGNKEFKAPVEELDPDLIPEVIQELGRETL